MRHVIYYDTMTREVLMTSTAAAPKEEPSEPVAAAAASAEPNPVAERTEEPTVTPVEGSEKAAESTVTPVAAAEEASLPFYMSSGSLRAPAMVRVTLRAGEVVPMAITTGPVILFQPEK